jgi:hypothetical protein
LEIRSNPNQTKINKNITIAEFSRETHLVQMTTQASFFADREKDKQFHPRMKLKRSLNTRGDHCSSNSRIDQKLTHKWGLECNGERKLSPIFPTKNS